MIAKLIINEIKQDVDGSSLGRLDIGVRHLTKASVKLNELFPGIVSDDVLHDILNNFLSSITVKTTKDVMSEHIRVISEGLENLNEYVVLNLPEDVGNINNPTAKKINDYIREHFLNPDRNEIKKIVNGEYYNEKRIWTAGFLCYVNINDGIGYIILTDMTPGNKKMCSYYFVRI